MKPRSRFDYGPEIRAVPPPMTRDAAGSILAAMTGRVFRLPESQYRMVARGILIQRSSFLERSHS